MNNDLFDELRNNELKNIETRIQIIKQFEQKIQDLINVNNELSDKVSTLSQNIDEIKTNIGDIQTNFEKEKENKINELNNELEKEKSNNENKVKELQETINQLESEKATAENEANKLQETINQQTESINNLKSEKATAENRANELQETINQQAESIKTLHTDDEINELNSKMQKLEQTNQSWEELTQMYKPVLENINKCATFNTIRQDYDITGTDTSDLFKIIKAIGKTIDFAKEIHTCALNVKQENSEPMTQDEIAVYEALNDCYRQIWQIDFDIFILPGNKLVNAEFTKIPFDKNEAVNMKKPSERDWKFTQKVYVPLLKARSGNMHTQAQVQAGNM